MFPLRDDIQSRTTPFVNYALIFVNVMVFFHELLLGPYLNNFIAVYGVIPARWIYLFNGYNISIFSILITYFTSMFLHGGWMHLIGNMWFLYIFGDNVEDRLGHVFYFLYYLACGLAAGIFHSIINIGSTLPSIGASGAIAGVLAAYLLFYPHARILTLIPFFLFFPIVEIPAVFMIGFWFVMQLIEGMTSLGLTAQSMGGVAWWAHIGGFVFGLLIISKVSHRKRIHGMGYF